MKKLLLLTLALTQATASYGTPIVEISFDAVSTEFDKKLAEKDRAQAEKDRAQREKKRAQITAKAKRIAKLLALGGVSLMGTTAAYKWMNTAQEPVAFYDPLIPSPSRAVVPLFTTSHFEELFKNQPSINNSVALVVEKKCPLDPASGAQLTMLSETLAQDGNETCSTPEMCSKQNAPATGKVKELKELHENMKERGQEGGLVRAAVSAVWKWWVTGK